MKVRALCVISIVLFLNGSVTASTVSTTEPNLKAHGNWHPVADERLEQGVLDNGLHWYAFAVSDQQERVEIRMRVNAGSLNEKPDQLGLAHFVEHMAFNGTTHFPKNDIVRFFESAGVSFGGDINAFTSHESTLYKLSIPADQPELINTAFEVLYEWSNQITFEQEEVKKEALVVIEEWRARYGSDKSTQVQEYEDLYAHTLWLEQLPIGNLNTVLNANASDLREFYTTWYRPDNIDILVAYPEGSLDVESSVKKYFSNWTVESDKPSIQKDSKINLAKAKFIQLSDRNTTYNYWNAYVPIRQFKKNSKEDRESQYINELLSSTLTARFARLSEVEAPAIFSAYVNTGFFDDESAYLNVYLEVYDGQEKQALNQIGVELNRLKTYGLTRQELLIAKDIAEIDLNGLTSWIETATAAELIDGYGEEIATEQMLESFASYESDYRSMLNKVTLRTINNYISSLYDSDQIAGYLHHGENNVPQSDDWQSIYSSAWDVPSKRPKLIVSKVNMQPYARKGQVLSENDLMTSEGLCLWELENNLPVVFKPSDLEEDLVNIQLLLLGGKSIFPKALDAAANYWPSIRIDSGFGGVSGQDLEDEFNLRGISFTLDLNQNFSWVTINGPSAQIDFMLQTINGLFLEENFDARKAKLLLKATADERQQFKQVLGYDFYTRFIHFIYNDDPRYVLHSSDAIAALTIDQFKQVQRELLRKNYGAQLVVVGEIPKKRLQQALINNIAGLPISEASSVERFSPITRDSTTFYANGQGDDRTSIYESLVSKQIQLSPMTAATSQVLSDLLEHRLNQHLREDAGLTYGVFINQFPRYKNGQQWAIRVEFDTDPVREADALSLLEATLQKLSVEAFTEAEVVEAKKRIIAIQRQYVADNDGALNALADSIIYGYDLADYDNQDEVIAQVTPRQVNEMLHQFLEGTNVISVFRP